MSDLQKARRQRMESLGMLRRARRIAQALLAKQIGRNQVWLSHRENFYVDATDAELDCIEEALNALIAKQQEREQVE